MVPLPPRGAVGDWQIAAGRRKGQSSRRRPFQSRGRSPRTGHRPVVEDLPRHQEAVRPRGGQEDRDCEPIGMARGVIGNTPGFDPGIPSSSLGGPVFVTNDMK